MKLRPYQKEAVENIHESMDEYGSTLLVLPTGCGKTIVFAHSVDEAIDKNPGMRAAVLAHREELITQAVDKIRRATKRTTEIEMADTWAINERGMFGTPDVLVSSIQTQCARWGQQRRMHRFDPQRFCKLVIDEAHHATADTYRRVIEHYQQNPQLGLLGVTATPDRHDEAALGQIFKSVAYVYEIQDAINDGWLVPIEQSSVDVHDLDIASIRTTAGDLNGRDLERALLLEKPLLEMTGPTMDIAGDRKTLVFAASVAHAERICEIFNREKPNAARYVTGKTNKEDRRKIFRDYTQGRFQYLVNVAVATEGFDEPSIEVIAMMRPTKSRALYAQMIGRGTRPLTGLVDPHEDKDDRRRAIADSPKPAIEVVDFVGNSGRHRLIRPADILGGNYNDDVVERAIRNAAKSGKPTNVQDELDKASREIADELERQRRKHIRAKAAFSKRTVNPFDTLGITTHRERGWDKVNPATEKQMNVLRKFKVDIPKDGFSKAAASRIIGTLFQRIERGICTYGQAKVLKRAGYDGVDAMTKDEASRLIDVLAKNNWQRPQEVEQCQT